MVLLNPQSERNTTIQLLFAQIGGLKLCNAIPAVESALEQRIIRVMRFRHYSRRTEESYVGWYRRFVLWHKQRAGNSIHPKNMKKAEVEALLTHLAVNRDFSLHSETGSQRPHFPLS